MPHPKTGTTHFHARLVIQDISRSVKELIVRRSLNRKKIVVYPVVLVGYGLYSYTNHSKLMKTMLKLYTVLCLFFKNLLKDMIIKVS